MPETTLQPDASAGIDTILSENSPTTNFGTGTTLAIKFESDGDNHDILVKFDLSPIAPGSIIQEAKMTLHAESNIGDVATVEVQRILPANSGWTEAGATWNTQDGSAAWAGSAGLETSGVDYDPDPLFTGDSNDWAAAAPGPFDFDLIPTRFQKLIDIGNHGMRIASTLRTPTVNRNITNSSSDHATASQRPKLFVRWLEPSGRLAEYVFNIWDEDKIIRDSKGAVVRPNEVRPNNWIKVDGFELPRGRAFDSLVEDPTTSFIVGTDYDEARESVRITTNRSQFAELIIQRLAGGGG